MPFVKGDPRLIGNKFGRQFYKGQFDHLQPNWKGDEVSYVGLHKWLFRRKGRPLKCEGCGDVKRCQWANISGEYKRDLNDYRSLCSSCHKKEDYHRRYGNKCTKGHELSGHNLSIVVTKDRIYRRCKICSNASAARWRKANSK